MKVPKGRTDHAIVVYELERLTLGGTRNRCTSFAMSIAEKR